MRTGAIVLLLLLGGCGGSRQASDPGNGADNAALPQSELPEAGATLALSAAGGGCSARWNGAAVTPEQLLERAGAAIEAGLATAGGIENLSAETLPVVRVEAPADMAFACVDAMLVPLHRAGFPRLILAPAGRGEGELAHFPLTEIGPPPPSAVVRIGAGGRMTLNNQPVDLAGLTERARTIGGPEGPPPPPGELEIRPAREARFGAVFDAVRAARQGNVLATLLPPSIEPRPRPPTP